MAHYDSYTRNELLARIFGLERSLQREGHEVKRLQDDLVNERNRSASLSRTVLRQQRDIGRLEAEIARLDDIAAPHIAKSLIKKAG